jgi:hypothetical protein
MNGQIKVFAGVIAMALTVGTVMSAQVPATVTLRSGETLAVTMMDLGAPGFQVSVNGAERIIPKDQVAMVDFGGNVTPQASWFNGMTKHLVVFKNGEILQTEWVDIGGAMPLILRVNSGSGERELTTNEVARIYLVAPAGIGNTGNVISGGGVQPDGSVTVNAADPWTSTGIRVRTGEMLNFSATREIRVGPGANDISNANGNPAISAGGTLFRRLPVTRVPVGTLIAKVGNNGQPFELGAAPPPVRMPANGVLFLGINDLTFNDNSGWFRVVVSR